MNKSFECGICHRVFTSVTGLNCHARSVHPLEQSGLTEDEYKVKVLNRTETNTCSICGKVDYAFTFTRGRPLCRDCVSKYAINCPICGSLITWQAQFHFTKCHPEIKMPNIGELKAVCCKICNKIIRMTRVDYGVREYDIREFCDECFAHSIECPSCHQLVHESKDFYAHLYRCYRGKLPLLDFIDSLPESIFKSKVLFGLNLTRENGVRGSIIHADNTRGKSFSEIYGDSRSVQIKNKISKTMINNESGWKFWQSYSPEHIKSVIHQKVETRKKQFDGLYFSPDGLSRMRLKAGFLSVFGQVHQYSKVSEKFFQKLDKLLGVSDSEYAKHERLIKLENSGDGKYRRQVILLDYYNQSLGLAIEFFGDFWHGNPKIYSPDDLILNRQVSDIWGRDCCRTNLLLKTLCPRFFYIVWESDQEQMLEVILNDINNARTLE